MKTKFILIVTMSQFFFLTKVTTAQDNESFTKGNLVATVGFGFPDFNRSSLRTNYNIYNYSNNSVTGIGPFIIKGDYGIVKFKWGHVVGAGIVLGFNTTQIKYDYFYTNTNKNYSETDIYTTVTVGARGSYHFYTKNKIDCYASVGLGFNVNTNSQSTTNPNGVINSSSLSKRPSSYEALTVGIRYYFSKNIGVYAEAGWDMHVPLQGGLAIKF